jgi:hypothetical protein
VDDLISYHKVGANGLQTKHVLYYFILQQKKREINICCSINAVDPEKSKSLCGNGKALKD